MLRRRWRVDRGKVSSRPWRPRLRSLTESESRKRSSASYLPRRNFVAVDHFVVCSKPWSCRNGSMIFLGTATVFGSAYFCMCPAISMTRSDMASIGVESSKWT